MISKLKMWLGIALTFLFGGLVAFASYQKKRADDAAEEAEEAKNKANQASRRADVHKELTKAKKDAQQRAKSDAEIIEQIKENGRRPGSFSSSSLLDD